MKKIDRLEFLQLAGAVLGAGVATAAVACGGDDTKAASGPACDTTPPKSTIALNHALPHQLTVTAADARAGQSQTYHIKGMADHDHTVDFSVADFASLEQGSKIFATSSVFADGHSHSITLTCV